MPYYDLYQHLQNDPAAVGGGGVSDGDKGDIVVTGSGASWSIDAGAVVADKIATGAVQTAKIADANVTYAKIQNVTDSRLLGRSDGSAGPPREISIGTGLTLTAGPTATLSASSSSGMTLDDVLSVQVLL